MTLSYSISLLLLVAAQAEPSPAPEEVPFAEQSAEVRLASLKQEAAEYKLALDTGDRSALVLSEPVLRFNDNITGVVDGVLLFWLRDEQPQAMASFWHRADGLIAHEFQSLAEDRVLASRGDKTVWHPAVAGIVPRPLMDVAEPATTAPGRLSQMRAAIRDFQAATGTTNRRELRLLPQPVHRYGEASAETLDAAWFTFAKGTNPEVMVLIEARRGEDGGYAWQYAPVRMTSAACELRRDGVPVWAVPRDRGERPLGIYFNIYTRE